MTNPQNTTGKLLTDEEVERIEERISFHSWSNLNHDQSWILVETDIPALLADRALRLEREKKVRETLEEVERVFILTTREPVYMHETMRHVREALSLLSQ